jgi:hypothetical protein
MSMSEFFDELNFQLGINSLPSAFKDPSLTHQSTLPSSPLLPYVHAIVLDSGGARDLIWLKRSLRSCLRFLIMARPPRKVMFHGAPLRSRSPFQALHYGLHDPCLRFSCCIAAAPARLGTRPVRFRVLFGSRLPWPDLSPNVRFHRLAKVCFAWRTFDPMASANRFSCIVKKT